MNCTTPALKCLVAIVAVLFFGIGVGCGRLGYDPREDTDWGTDAARLDGAVFDMTLQDLAPLFDATTDALDAAHDMGVPAVPGVTVSPVSGLTTSEFGGTATFTVVLDAAPDEATPYVLIVLSSTDAGEGTVAPTILAFTPGNWNAPQTVTVSGVDDAIADGSVSYAIVTAPCVTVDPAYAGLDPSDVSVSNVDDETAGVTLSRTSGLSTSESGATDTFTVRLNSAPTSDVAIDLSSSVVTEATPAPATLTFTALNYASPQTVTVTGVDDGALDGNQAFTIVTAPAVSADGEYDGVDAADATGTNLDNETAGIVITPTSGISTTESGGMATFSVSLQAPPSAPVSIALMSTDLGEGTVPGTPLMFTTSNWNMPVSVTVTGVDDGVVDGAQVYRVHVGPASSADANYAGLDGGDVTLTNFDNDVASLVVAPLSGVTTTEIGGTTTFTVALGTAPLAPVTLSVASNNTLEGTVSPATLVFSTSDWATPQTVTVTGADDAVADGDVPYAAVVHLMTSGDPDYMSLGDVLVSITNVDNESVGVTVTPTTGLTTTESGGTASFAIVLDSRPVSDVSIALASDVPSEGVASAASVNFTPLNWSTPQTVTVTGTDDFVVDGARIYHIVTGATTSASPQYNGIAVSDVTVTNADNDTAGVVVMPSSGLTTTEGGGTASFAIVLTSQPASGVSIALSSSNTLEGTVSPGTVSFTTSNWSTPQTVIVTGVNDFVDDGDIAYSVVTAAAVSGDAMYSGAVVADVSLTNTDNDAAGATLTPGSGLVTTEAGATATFTIALTSQPTASVTIALSSSALTEGTVAPASVSFTTMDWSVPQTVTVTGVNDFLLDPDTAFTIVTAAAASADAAYSGLAIADVSVTNQISAVYIKASNTNAGDRFGHAVALSADRTTLAVSAPFEASNSRVINAGASDNSAANAGAVYVFVRSGGVWSQQAYLKAANADANDYFGESLAISSDGNTLTVGAYGESSNATGINGNAANNSADSAGAAYVFTRSGTTWTQQAYLKASNAQADDYFGNSMALSADGNTLTVGARFEDSNALLVNGNQADNSANQSGAVYVFVRAAAVWSQQAYLKRSAAPGAWFGWNVALASDGNTLAVFGNLVGDGWVDIFLRAGATWSFSQRLVGPAEGNGFGVGLALAADASTLVVGINQGDFVFTRSGMTYTQQGARLYSTNVDPSDYFGYNPAVTADGSAFAVAASQEDSNAVRINGDGSNNSLSNSGAAYTFTRAAAVWSQQCYVKAPAPDANDNLAGLTNVALAISPNLDMLVLGAQDEASSATGIGGNQADNSAASAGCVYVY
jgi:hypothetical protein